MASLEYITPLPATSPFLFTDSSEDSNPPEASGSSEVPPSQDPYVTNVSRWKSRVTTRSSLPSDFSIAHVIASHGTHRRATILILPEEAILLGRPYRTLPNTEGYVRLDEPGQALFGTSTRVVSPRLGYPLVRALRHSEAFLHCVLPHYLLFIHRLHQSHHQEIPPIDSVPPSTPVMGSLAPTHAD
nr:hypothetical protein [Tanacetum cinerariifolium]